MAAVDLRQAISPGFTDNVLQHILQKQSGFTDISILKINIATSSTKGDSYLSTVLRFTVEARGKNGSEDNQNFQVNVIVKKIPDVPARAKTFRSLDFFDCESDFYNKVWPTLDAFQKSQNLEKLFESIPACLATYADGISDFIALEDLSYQGYTAVPRTSGLDLETTVFILKHFAQFHGLAVAYRDLHPKEFEKITSSLKETYFDEKYRKWYSGSLDRFIVVVKDAAEKELPPSYLLKLNEVTTQDLFGNICKLLKERTPLCAITHGDCWAPNFLLKQTNGEQKLAIIDFQLMRYASLATDIHFLIYSCVDPMVRNEHWNLLIKEYHEAFVSTLKKLGSKLNISLEELQEEMKRFGLFAFGMCNEAITMSLMDDEDLADLESIRGEEGIPLHEVWKIKPIKDTMKRQRVASYIKHLIDNGFI